MTARFPLMPVASALLLSVTPACSIAFVQPGSTSGAAQRHDPEGAPEELQPCTESYTAPVIDTVLGSLLSVGGVVGIASDDATASFGGPSTRAAGALSLVTGLFFAASAVHGYSEVEACREHNRQVRLHRPETATW